MDDNAREKHEDKLIARECKIKKISKYSLKSLKKEDPKFSENASSRSRSNAKRKIPGDNDAKQAALCGGLFSNLVCDVQGALYADDGLVNTDSEAMTSPFCFLADWIPSTDGSITTPQRVFLKVWKVGDVDLDDVQAKNSRLQHAYKTGVPVAAPVLDELFRSKSRSGSEYLILAVEYIHDHKVRDENDFILFCISLIKAAIQLHENAGLLHCDLKPDNMRWSGQVVRLIDFGHSQQIDKAMWSRGTKGFEAPEIVNGTMPCSIKTEAFSVGATIQSAFKQLNKSLQQNRVCHAVHDVAVRLQDHDPKTRFSLQEALRKKCSIHENER